MILLFSVDNEHNRTLVFFVVFQPELKPSFRTMGDSEPSTPPGRVSKKTDAMSRQESMDKFNALDNTIRQMFDMIRYDRYRQMFDMIRYVRYRQMFDMIRYVRYRQMFDMIRYVRYRQMFDMIRDLANNPQQHICRLV